MTTPAEPGPQPDLEELLSRCENEPIHIPGAIQPHGTLLAFDGSAFDDFAFDDFAFGEAMAVVASTDASDVLGRPLTEVLGPDAAAAIAAAPLGQPLTFALAGSAIWPDRVVDLTAHRSGELLVVEVEEPSEVDLDSRFGVLDALRQLQTATSVDELVSSVGGVVRQLTGFDRIMVYRFDDEWNGEVVAEHRRASLDPFLGLRYPASDIPAPARALYLRNRTRLIPDAKHEPVPLVTSSARAASNPLDLSDSSLRAVSPVHLEYLANMGVAASMSAALVVDNQLWGLVACHHYDAPRRPSQRMRAAVDVIARVASVLLAQLISTAVATERLALFTQIDAMTSRLADADTDVIAELVSPDGQLRRLLDADGVVAFARGAIRRDGMCPPDDAVNALVRALDAASLDVFVTSNAAGVDTPRLREATAEVAPHAAGIVAHKAGDADDTTWLLWFRREQIESVRWGGDPTHKEMLRDPTGGLRLGPRRSFAEYVELVRDHSAPWTDAELEAARELTRRATAALERQVRRDRVLAAAMQKAVLLEALPEVPGTEVAVLYEPATRFGVGGDWYDLFFLRDGRAVLALGDVAGHGFEVAATMAQLRHAMRAYIVREGDLGAAMRELNELARTLLPGEMATAIVAVFTPDARRIDIINAGHLPPVVVRDHSTALLPLPRHPALGLRRDVEFTASTVTLAPNDAIVLYTDGLVERRDADLLAQLDALVARADQLRGTSPEALCRDLRDSLRDQAREDDATVFALRFPA